MTPLKQLAALVLAGFALLGASGSAPSAQASPPTVVRFTNAFGVVVVYVRINGRGPFALMLDTASRTTIVSPKLAAILQLPALLHTSRVGAGANDIPVIATTLASMTISGLARRNVEAIEMELPESLAHRLPHVVIVGYVGCDFFKGTALTIDYASSQLIVSKNYAPNQNATTLPMHLSLHGSVPSVVARFDGVAGTFLVDSGNSGWPTLNHAYAERAGIDTRYPSGTPMSSEAAGNQPAPMRELCLDRFSLGSDFHMSHVPVYADAGAGVSAWPDQDGALGYEILRRVRTTLDFNKRLVYFERTKPVTDADYATLRGCAVRYGFGLGAG